MLSLSMTSYAATDKEKLDACDDALNKADKAISSQEIVLNTQKDIMTMQKDVIAIQSTQIKDLSNEKTSILNNPYLWFTVGFVSGVFIMRK